MVVLWFGNCNGKKTGYLTEGSTVSKLSTNSSGINKSTIKIRQRKSKSCNPPPTSTIKNHPINNPIKNRVLGMGTPGGANNHLSR